MWFGFSPEKYQKVQDIPEPGGLSGYSLMREAERGFDWCQNAIDGNTVEYAHRKHITVAIGRRPPRMTTLSSTLHSLKLYPTLIRIDAPVYGEPLARLQRLRPDLLPCA